MKFTDRLGDIFYNYFEYIIVFLVLILFMISHQAGCDFYSFYFPAKLIANGNATHIYEIEVVKQFESQVIYDIYPYLYPPFFAFLLVPLTIFKPLVAYWIYTFIQVFLLLFFFKLLKIIYLNRKRLDILIFITITSAAATATVRNLTHGQSNILVNTFWLYSLFLFIRDKKIIPSLLLSVAIMIKMLPAISLLILLFNKKYKEIFLTIAFCIILTSFTMIFTGFDIWKYFILNFNDLGTSILSYAGIRPLLNRISPELMKYWLIFPLIFITILMFLHKNIDLKKGWAITDVLFPISSSIYWAHHNLPLFTTFSYYATEKIHKKFWLYSFYILGAFSFVRYSKYIPFSFRTYPLILTVLIVFYIEIKEFLKLNKNHIKNKNV